MANKTDIVVIGAGAAGVMAAGIAAAAGCRVTLCEKMEKPQRKVRITGKGRCNLTNVRPREEFLAKIRAGVELFGVAFDRFDNQQTVEFFERIGVPLTVERGGRVFPTSSKAWDIADGHTAWCKSRGVKLEMNARVTNINMRDGHLWSVTIERRTGEAEEILAKAVVVATGGLSYPATGSTGDGLMLAHGLGHKIVEVRPSLTPLETEPAPTREMVGLSLKNISATLLIDGQTTATEFGEMEFTPFGIGGAIVLRLSRMAVDAVIDERSVELSVDLKPALGREKLLGRIDREIEKLPSRSTTRELIAKLMPSALIGFFLKQAGLSPTTPLSLLNSSTKEMIVSTIKALTISIVDYRPFEEAVVTAGGVATDQIDQSNFGSKLVEGLFFAGEVLDIDADTGGYNLQVAYSTGYAAGEGAARYVNGLAK